jgi:ATP adenylyltransferase
MDNLWAPWRMSYVAADDKEAGGCFLCKAWVAGEPAAEAASLVVHRGPAAMILLNRFPYNNGHLLVAPAAHVAGLTDLDDAGLLELMKTTRLAQRLLAAAVHAQGFNIGINLGLVAGAGVPGHLHVHVVPRWQGDTNFMTTTAGTRVIPQSLEDLRDRLLAALPACLAEEGGR